MESFCEREAADSGAHGQNSLLVIYDNKTSFMKSNIKIKIVLVVPVNFSY